MNKFYSLVTTHKGKIIDIGYDKNGKKIIKNINFKPIIGLENNEESEYRDLYGNSLKIKEFKNINEGRQYIKENKDNFPIYGDIPAEYQYINETYKDIDFDYTKMKIFIYDIEVVSSKINWDKKIKIRKNE